jgi:hypothetical protein
MITVQDDGHCSKKESMGNGVYALLGCSISWSQFKERQFVVDWAQGDGKGVRALVCPFPDDLSYTVHYLLLVAVVGNLFSYLP